jgi:DNA-3-methyladenine glycosylase II
MKLAQNVGVMKEMNFTLRPLAPFRLDLTAWTLRRRDRNIVDSWDGRTYSRMISIPGPGARGRILIHVRQSGTIDAPLLHVTTNATGITKSTRTTATLALERLLGLSVDMNPFYRFAAQYPKLDTLAQRFKGIKPPRFNSVFEALVNGIACQQFSLEAGLSILNRLTRKTALSSVHDNETYYSFPTPHDISTTSIQSLRALGLSQNKALALKTIAQDILESRFDPESLSHLTNAEARSRLLELKGIGRWTAEYVLLRGLGRLDVFPGDDVGARGNLARWLEIEGIMDYLKVEGALRQWAPYKGLIYFHLLLDGLERTGQLANTPKAA